MKKQNFNQHITEHQHQRFLYKSLKSASIMVWRSLVYSEWFREQSKFVISGLPTQRARSFFYLCLCNEKSLSLNWWWLFQIKPTWCRWWILKQVSQNHPLRHFLWLHNYFLYLCLLTDLARSVCATSRIELLNKSGGKDCQNAVWWNEKMRLPVSLMNSLVKGAKEFPGSLGPFQVCLYLSNTKKSSLMASF